MRLLQNQTAIDIQLVEWNNWTAKDENFNEHHKNRRRNTEHTCEEVWNVSQIAQKRNNKKNQTKYVQMFE